MTCNGMAQGHKANHGNLPQHLKEFMEAQALQPQVDPLNLGPLEVALDKLLQGKPLLLEDQVVSTEEVAQVLFMEVAALFMEEAALFMEVAIAVEELSILVEVDPVDQAVAGVLVVEAGAPVVPHTPEAPTLVDHQGGQVAVHRLEEVEPLLLEVEVPLLLEDLVVFIEEEEQAATIHLVDLALPAALPLTAPHQAAPQAHLHTAAAGEGSIFIKSVKVLFLFA